MKLHNGLRYNEFLLSRVNKCISNTRSRVEICSNFFLGEHGSFLSFPGKVISSSRLDGFAVKQKVSSWSKYICEKSSFNVPRCFKDHFIIEYSK